MSRAMKTVSLVLFCALIIAVPSVRANWVQDGIPICTATGDQEIYLGAIASVGAGGAIVTWYDGRSGDFDIYAQRVDASGTVLWATDGVPLCTATGSQVLPVVISDGVGGAIVTWVDNRAGNYGIYTQRVDASGTVRWAPDGICLCMATGDEVLPAIVSDGEGGAIITWEDDTRGNNSDVYAQHVDASGTLQWATGGVAVCTATGNQRGPAAACDGEGGVIVAWYDRRSGVDDDVYAQRVDASGTVRWATDGVPLCTATGHQWNYPGAITADGTGGAIVTWEDYRSESGIYGQRVNASGVVQWTVNGVAICTAAGSSKIISDDVGGAIVTWTEWGNVELGTAIYAQRVDASGALQWATDGVPLCTATGNQFSAQITTDGAGGAIVTWDDYRKGPAGIYAQRVDASGTVRWATDGVPLCMQWWRNYEGIQYNSIGGIISDGAGGAIVAWNDRRNLTNWDIYAQRVNANGDQPIATLLQCYSSSVSEHGITLKWTLSEMDADIEFLILRAAQGASDFDQLSAIDLVRNGLSFAFVDSDVESGTTYTYRVDIQMGNERKTLFETGPIETPAMPVTLYQNHPNPFNPSTLISYYVPTASRITLDVYDSSGELIVRLIDREEQPKGKNTVEWRGVDAQGRTVSSGVYFWRLRAGKTEMAKKMVLTR